MLIIISFYIWLLIHRPAMREKHFYFWKTLFSRGISLRDMNPEQIKPLHSVNAMGLTGARWMIADYGDYTMIQPITCDGVKIGLPKKTKQPFDKVVNRLITFDGIKFGFLKKVKKSLGKLLSRLIK